MSVTPRQAADSMRRRYAAEQRKLDAQFDLMAAEARRIIESIESEFDPVRIYQWGSLLDRAKFRSYSDIDIAVEGVTDAARWMALERMAWEMSDYPLDIVQLEHVEPEYAEIIRGKGRIVYGQAR